MQTFRESVEFVANISENKVLVNNSEFTVFLYEFLLFEVCAY